ncbi:GGDEF domain-containing protein [Couchioplanes caeruleus]|uniref:GGDEF domain-containing protein n=1 Tax=Couchioplanes caeruleus TaxID=56438 RepID=UPI0020BD60AC|nr:GGDEF domain-containing protein [Couchioplanes caeruleus]UQU66096.1 GGDEF domain-containing protein [Couchioplanes caeruleus]
MTRGPLARARRADPLLVALIALLVATFVGFGSGAGSTGTQVTAFWLLMIAVQVPFAVSARRVAGHLTRSGTEDAHGGAMWRLFSTAGVVLVLGNVVQVVLVLRDPLSVGAAIGTDPQAASLALAMALIVAALLRYPMGEMGAAARLRMRIDVATVMAAATTFGLWIFELPPGPRDAGWVLHTTTVMLVQPGLFLVAVFAVVKILLGGRSAFVRTAGVLSGTTAMLQAVLQAVPVPYYVAPPTMSWLFAANVLASGLIAIGARVQERQVRAGARTAPQRAKRPYSLLPYAAMAAVWLLAAAVLALHGLDLRAWVVVAGANVTTALVVARQVAAFRHIAELLRERDELTAQLTRMAYHDALTELANRSLFMQRLSDGLAAGPVTVFLIDLDEFKPVNDAYGHATGDRLLIEVGRRLRGCVRAGDTVARLGGDEFAVLILDVSDDRRRQVADDLARALRGTTRIGAVEVPLTASIGMAVGRDGGQDPDSLLHEADMAMYATKEHRRHLSAGNRK